MNLLELTGQARSHIKQKGGYAIHLEAEQAYLDLVAGAEKDGITIKAFSSFRDFNSQLKIWNNKFSGKRTLYDQEGQELDFARLTEDEIFKAILNWSALPGASRHHWGSEIDVFDSGAIAEDYQIQLLPFEYEEGGPFDKLNDWLGKNLETYGFFRPYQRGKSGVAFEPWHISYFPVSKKALEQVSADSIRPIIQKSEILGKKIILKELDMIFETYLYKIASPKNL